MSLQKRKVLKGLGTVVLVCTPVQKNHTKGGKQSEVQFKRIKQLNTMKVYLEFPEKRSPTPRGNLYPCTSLI